jgi:hypothetical protein
MSSSFQVLLGDPAAPADAAFYDLLTELEVEENADLPGAIQLTLPITTEGEPDSEDLTVVGDALFGPFAHIAVVVSVDNKPDACIFDGYVLSHKIHLDTGTTEATVQIWGQDASCLMNLEDKVHEWNQTDADIANAIFGLAPYNFTAATANTADDSGPHPESGHTVMQRGTDAQFLRDRARRAGKLFRVCCDQQAGSNTGYFITPTLVGTPVATLVLNPASASNVDSLDFEWDVARPTEVKASALTTTKDAVDVDATESGLRLADSQSLAGFAGRTTMTRLTTTVDARDQLERRVKSVLREAGWFVKCEGEADLARLQTVLRVGSLVEIDGAGKLHSGNYFVWSVRHSITPQSHRMKFVLMRNAVGAP